MSFIKSYGVALPYYRIEDSIINPLLKKSGSKTVCNTDEDIITLAYDAIMQCIISDNLNIDAVFFATNSPILRNCYHSTIVADLAGIEKSVFCLDFIGTDRSGTDALLLANELVNSGKYKNIIVVASEVKYSAIGDELIANAGHGACAILISNENGLAEIDDSTNIGSHISEEFIYKNNEIKLDARYSRDAGFKKNIDEVIKYIQKYKESCEKIVLNSKYSKLAVGQFLKSGFKDTQFSKDNISPISGNTGVANSFFQIINEIENGTNSILLIDYTNGSNIFYIKSFNNSLKILKNKLGNFGNIKSYQDYLKLRKEGNFNSIKYKTKDIFSSEMMNEREKESFIRLKGIKCKNCGTSYFIKTEKCKKCKSENFEKVQLSNKGKVYSFTKEHYFPVSFPPVTMLVVDLDGGGRITVQQTNCMYPIENNLSIGSQVQLVLRKMNEQDSKPNYFLKAVEIK